jgi:hypothetical protein
MLRAVASLPVLFAIHSATLASAQQPPDAQALALRLDRMQRQLDETVRQLDENRNTVRSLQQQMQAMAAAQGQSCGTLPSSGAGSLQQAVAELREEQSVQQAEIAVHEQAKVETRSRYNLKIGGLVLFNGFENAGSVDSVDVPVIAIPRTVGKSQDNVGASLRQSLITLDATGPQFGGAHTYANVQLDFFGGLSTADYTTTAGTVRMRAASLQTDWPTFRVRAGLERLLISQGSPTSYASIGEPAMAWSGNLWAWVPQLTAEKEFEVGESRQVQLAAALADIPDPGPSSSDYVRTPSAAERSRYPGVETRTGYSWGASHASGIGVSGYWSPHDYGTYGRVDAWAALADWHVILPERFEFSGQAYKGRALGGLGGGDFKDVASMSYYNEDEYAKLTRDVGLRDVGGWAQLKFHPINPLELNGAFGQDNDSAAQLRATGISLANPYSGLARNQTFLGNVIFRPRASFLLSLEYRKLRSWQLMSPRNDAQIFGLAAGYEF